MSKITNNEELVVDLMNFSPYGALSQAFIIDAITKQAKVVSELTDEDIAKIEEEGGSFVNLKSWRGVAQDIKKRMDEFYNR